MSGTCFEGHLAAIGIGMGNMFAHLETGVVGDPASDIFPLLAVSTNCDESQCWGTRVSEGAVGKVGREHRRDLVQRCHTLAPSEAPSLPPQTRVFPSLDVWYYVGLEPRRSESYSGCEFKMLR